MRAVRCNNVKSYFWLACRGGVSLWRGALTGEVETGKRGGILEKLFCFLSAPQVGKEK